VEFENFLKELETPENFSNHQKNVAEKIKSHNLPVIIFGAAKLAERVTETLKKFGVEILGYAVDGKYFKPNKTYLGLPIYNFDELRKTPKKFVFVLGFGTAADTLGQRQKKFLSDKEIFSYVIELENVDSISADYILENKEKFVETYDLLADDFSKKTMATYLKAHQTNSLEDISEVVVPNQYFNDLTRPAIQGGGHRIC